MLFTSFILQLSGTIALKIVDLTPVEFLSAGFKTLSYPKT